MVSPKVCAFPMSAALSAEAIVTSLPQNWGLGESFFSIGIDIAGSCFRLDWVKICLDLRATEVGCMVFEETRCSIRVHRLQTWLEEDLMV